MTKRIIALLLCAVMLVPVLASCAGKKDENDRGAYVTMYLTNEIYDFDPANAYYNTEAADILGMMFDTLFKINEKGKVEKSLVSKYTTHADTARGEYYMMLHLKEAYWSNGTALTSDDVVFTFKRLLNSNNNFAAASLLYDIKNARAVKEGDVSIDDLGVEAAEDRLVKISFEGPIDFDAFILNLTSVCTAPLLENYVAKDPDWAKKASTMVTSGPFKLGKIIYSDVTIDSMALVTEVLLEDLDLDLDALGVEELTRSTRLSSHLKMDDAAIAKMIACIDARVTEAIGQHSFRPNVEDRDSADYMRTSNVGDVVSYLDKTVKNGDLAPKNIHGSDPTSGAPFTKEMPSVVKEISYFYLERNKYYDRNDEKDEAIDAGVTPYRLLVDCTKTPEEILAAYQAGEIHYMNTIPLSLRNNDAVKGEVEITNGLSTFVCFLNENALIDDGKDGSYLFADAKVRQALSLAIDRDAIASAIVYAQAATGLVCPGVFNGNTKGKTDFRTAGGSILSTGENTPEASKLLGEAGITPEDYSFSIKVSKNDEVHCAIVEMIAAKWSDLGFNVTVDYVRTIQNNDYLKNVNGIVSDICDDPLVEAIQYNDYEVVAFDYVAYTADAYSMLSNLALSFSGMALDIDLDANSYNLTGHSTGYNSEAYNTLMEAIYYLPYFASLTEDDYRFLGIYGESSEDVENAKVEFKALYNAIKAVYEANGITPSTKASDWEKQKNVLLHKAEELLLNDMPVIPVIFNQKASMGRSELSGVKSAFYTDSIFTKAKLKNYEDLTYIDEIGDRVSIFADFPEIYWDKQGQDFSNKAEDTGK